MARLLAPAIFENVLTAIDAGADAVYFGGKASMPANLLIIDDAEIGQAVGRLFLA